MIYLYQHIRQDSGDVFYVGIGDKYRPYDKNSRNTHWNNIVKKNNYTVDIVRSFESWEEACEWEKFFISIYGKRHNNEGLLVNLTDGGEGSFGRSGVLHPFYGKKRPDHSLLLKGRKRDDISKRMSGSNHFFYGKKFTKDHKDKISRSKIGKYNGSDNPFYGKEHNDNTKLLISNANSKLIVDEISGTITFKSLKEASMILEIKETTLSAQLRGRNKNKTGYIYLKDYIKLNSSR